MKRIRSLKVKIAASQIGFILLIAVVLGSATYLSTVQLLKEAEQRHLQDIVEDIDRELDEIIEKKKKVLKELCGSEFLRIYTERMEDKPILRCFLDSMPHFSKLSYINKKGREEIKLVEGKISENMLDISRTELFQKVKEEPNTVFSILDSSPEKASQPYLKFGILHQNFFDEFLGIVTAKISLAELIAETRSIKISRTGFFMILDHQGKILWHPEKEQILKTASFAGNILHADSQKETGIQPGFTSDEIMGIDSYIAYSTSETYNWTILVVLPYEEFIAKPNQIRNTGILISVVILLLGILSSIALAAKINKPVSELVSATQSLGRGNLSKRVNVTTGDEIGKLSESFNKMAEDLERTTTSITRLNREIAEKKKAEEEIKKKAEHIASLYELGKKITSMISKEELLPWIATQAKKLLEADECFYRIRESDFLIMGGGTSKKMLAMLKEKLIIGESLSGLIALERKPLVISDGYDVDSRHNLEYKKMALQFGLKSFLGVPMMIGDNVAGVINVHSKQPEKFNKKDIELLTSFADFAAIALENARLFENLEKAKEEIEKSEKTLKEFSGKILSIREEEKRKLSIDLHDEVGTMAIALNSHLCIAEKTIKDGDLKKALQYIHKSRSFISSAAEKLKKLAAEIRPTDLDIVGLPSALRKYFSEINEREIVRIDFHEKIDKKVLDNQSAIVLYRVAQEALNNIIKHADAKNVKVTLASFNQYIKFDIRDDGKGFELKKGLFSKKKALTMGLIGMRERVESLRGIFLLESSLKKGTHIQVILPVQKE